MKTKFETRALSFVLGLLFVISSCSFSTFTTPSNQVTRDPAAVAAYSQSCASLVEGILSSRNFTRSITNLTKIEKELSSLPPVEPLDVQMKKAVQELEGQNPELAQKVRAAINRKASRGGHALEVDLSELSQKMANFLEGPFKKITGARGLSEPFVSVKMVNNDTLLVFHEGDKYPFLIRWVDTTSPSVGLIARKDLGLRGFRDIASADTFQVLSLPKSMTSKDELKFLDKEVHALIAGSRMNHFISSERSLVMKIASILHDEQLMFDRPTQKEFISLREKLNLDFDFRKAVRSLLFIAPTAAGKTRILGANVIDKVKLVNKLLVKDKKYSKKLSVVMANTPDLVNQLAQDIGKHVHSEVVPANYRIIQWGGLLSEDMPLAELMKFVERSDMPVILVTSSQTIASRVKSDGEIANLFRMANSLSIDEAHNSSSNTFKRVMNVSMQIAAEDRRGADVSDALDILGVTASPLTRTERTVEVFERSYWASIDTPGNFAKEVKESIGSARSSTASDVIEYVRIQQQFQNARARGEITAPENPLYFNPREFGHSFDNVFGRGATGTQPHVSIDKLKQVWESIHPMIEHHGAGVIQTYPRDADNVAETLSRLTGKNYVSLNLSDRKRDAVLFAFKTKTLYEGKPVDAIVGKIKEGLDFPDAGWFISFIRYVRFPGNIQAQGRVVRLSPDKVTPPIIYLGESVDSIAFRDVRELIFNKIGRLPRSLDEGRGFSGSRLYQRTHPNSKLGKTLPELNSSIEILFRQNGDIAREFAGEDPVDPETVGKLRGILGEILRSRGNNEVARAIKEFTHQAYSYSFYKENLSETWKYCDMLARVKTKGKPYPRTVKPEDIKILESASEMEKVAEFRAMRTWMGKISREVLQEMELRPRGVYDLGDTMSAFVERYGDDAIEAMNDWTLADEMRQAISVSSENLWNRLSYRARVTFESFFKQGEERAIEDTLGEYFSLKHSLPKFFFDKLEDGSDIVIDDKLSHRLAERLQAYLQTGKLELKKLDNEFLTELDKSPFFAKIVGQALGGLQGELKKVADELGDEGLDEISLSFEDLTRHEVFGSFRLIEELADMGFENSIQMKKLIESILERKGRDISYQRKISPYVIVYQ